MEVSYTIFNTEQRQRGVAGSSEMETWVSSPPPLPQYSQKQPLIKLNCDFLKLLVKLIYEALYN